MNINKSFQLAVGHYQSGKLREAESLCRQIVRRQPKHADALNLLGVICYYLANYDAAIEYIKKALELNPSNAEAYTNLGNAYRNKGELDKAITSYEKAIKLKPYLATAYNNMGSALQEKGRLDEAGVCYQRALKIDPNFDMAYNNLASFFLAKKEFEKAIVYCHKTIELNPKFSEAFVTLGSALQEKGSLDDAIRSFQKALSLKPDLLVAYSKLGLALMKKGEFHKAIPFFQKALKLSASDAEVYAGLGNAYKNNGQLDEAVESYQKALELNPHLDNAHYNLGVAMQEKGRVDEAITHYQKAIEFNPAFPKAYYNLGVAMQEKGRVDEAIDHYQKALQFDSSFAEAHFGLSVTQLLTGNFKQGWEEYGWRWKTKDFPRHCCFHNPIDFSQPEWDGSDIAGCDILIYSEQGLGDTIQFIRYVPLIAQRCKKVIVECHRELSSLLRNVEGVNQLIVRGEPLPDFDIHCSFLNLPAVFNTTIENIPKRIPYLTMSSASKEKWRDKVQHDNSKLKIGLAWAGSPTNKNDRNRSCSFASFSFLSIFKDITFYSLQKGEAAKQAKSAPIGLKLVDYTEEIGDFSDTAALIESLDLVICVDTAVAHLAGALGKPVWTMIPFAPDWRWMLNREDSPWYPTMRLFRQPSPGDWKSVIDKMKDELLIILNVVR